MCFSSYPPNHLLLDSAPNLGPLISRWVINKFGNCWYKSVRISEVLKLLFQKFLNLSSSQRDMSGPMLGDLSNNRWSGGNQEQSDHVKNIRFGEPSSDQSTPASSQESTIKLLHSIKWFALLVNSKLFLWQWIQHNGGLWHTIWNNLFKKYIYFRMSILEQFIL